jgi:hypothetical protein
MFSRFCPLKNPLDAMEKKTIAAMNAKVAP